MADISVTLPDGSGRLVADGSTVLDVAASIGSRLAQAAIAGTINGADVDVSTVVKDGDVVAIVTTNSDQGRHILRHSTAHVLAQAVVQLFQERITRLAPQSTTVSTTTLLCQIRRHLVMTTCALSTSGCAKSWLLASHSSVQN